MNSTDREALHECSIRLVEAHHQIEEMEQLIAQARSAAQRCERLGVRWQSHADTLLRLIRQDAAENSEA